MAISIPGIGDLTLVQNYIYNSKKDNIIVMGAPGTGKTILAVSMLEKIKNEAKVKNISFIVYNKTLHHELIKKYPSFIRTFDSWTFCMIRDNLLEKGLSHDDCKKKIIENYSNEQYNYNWDVISKEFEEKYGGSKLFGYIFIDEAQDIPSGALEFIKKYTEKIYIFYDDNQKINTDGNSEILRIFDAEEKFYDLTINFRNTKEIEKVINLFNKEITNNGVTIRASTAKKRGSRPVLLNVGDRYDLLIEKIKDMQMKNSSETIGLLIPQYKYRFDNPYYGQILFIRIKNLLSKHKVKYKAMFNSEEDNFSDDKAKVYLLSNNTAKGLEFDHVFLLDVNNPNMRYDTERYKKAFYVAMSRAKKNLYFCYDDKKEDSLITSTLKSNQKLIVEDTLIEEDLEELFD